MPTFEKNRTRLFKFIWKVDPSLEKKVRTHMLTPEHKWKYSPNHHFKTDSFVYTRDCLSYKLKCQSVNTWKGAGLQLCGSNHCFDYFNSPCGYLWDIKTFPLGIPLPKLYLFKSLKIYTLSPRCRASLLLYSTFFPRFLSPNLNDLKYWHLLSTCENPKATVEKQC